MIYGLAATNEGKDRHDSRSRADQSHFTFSSTYKEEEEDGGEEGKEEREGEEEKKEEEEEERESRK